MKYNKKMKYNIREAKSKDLDSIMNLLYQLSPPKKETNADKKNLLKILNKIIKDSNYYICVYEDNRKILGTGTLLVQLNLSHEGRPYGHIENIVVDKNYRGKGIGKKIIKHLNKKAKEFSCYKTILDCNKNNIFFYNSCGMKETGEVEMRMDL